MPNEQDERHHQETRYSILDTIARVLLEGIIAGATDHLLEHGPSFTQAYAWLLHLWPK